MYRLKLLGCVGLEGPDGVVDGCATQPRRLALLALLDACRGGWMGREKILGYLWPQDPTRNARHHLSDSIYALRKALGDGVIVVLGDSLRVNPDVVHSDAAEFRDAVKRGDLKRAAQVYAGPFLDGFYIRNSNGFGFWADEERRQLARCQATALAALAKEARESGDYTTSIAWWERLVSHDPFSAHSVTGLMMALEASGEPAKALIVCRDYEDRLMSELGMRPSAKLVTVCEEIRRRCSEPE